MKDRGRRAFWTLLAGLIFIAGATTAVAQIQVTSATPNNAAQGTVSLDVVVKGNGFQKGAKAQWFVSGTTNPGGVTVNSTAFNNSGQLTANITVAADAVVSGFDILVTNSNGRSGKGTELFAISSSSGGSPKATCPLPPVITPSINACSAGTDQAGCLDSTFGSGGLVETTGSDADSAYSVRQQTDGKLVAIGHFFYFSGSTETSGVIVRRYNTDGSLDTSFGSGGEARYIANSNGSTPVWDGVIDSAGNILVTGSGSSSFIVRFTPAGVLDSTFGTGGVATFNGYGGPQGVALQPDGKIVVSSKGSIKTTQYGWILRFNANGTLDTTFGSKGIVQRSGFGFTDIVIQQLGGSTYILAATNSFSIQRYTASGVIDATFGTSGEAKSSLCGYGGQAWNMALDPVSGIYLAGYAVLQQGGQNKIYLTKYTDNGQLDTTFGNTANAGEGPTGATILDFGGMEYNSGLTIARDAQGNTQLLIGVLESYSPYFYLARYRANGTLDTTFGGVGAVATTFDGPTWSAGAASSVIQSDGRIVQVGANQGPTSPAPINFALARFWP